MKKIFVWLLITAAGAGIATSCNTFSTPGHKSLLIGKWQMDSVDISKTTDSSFSLLALLFIAQDPGHKKLEFSFHANGLITEDNDDGTDSSHYSWDKNEALLVWSTQDSTKEKWSIRKLDSIKLVVTAEDSVTFFFRRIK